MSATLTGGGPPAMLLEVVGLESHYGRVRALAGLDLAIAEGELLALVGANGAGKTTLLRAISGVQRASAGRIRFAGRDVTHAPPSRRVAFGIAQVPEGRQVFAPRHRRALHQHGDDRDVSTERFLDFETHEVFRIVQPAAACSVTQRGPSLPDHYEHRSGLTQRRLQDANEVCSGINRVDVQEDVALPEAPVHVVGEATGLAGCIISSVADEDPWWHRMDQLVRGDLQMSINADPCP